jgi:hypothetical protein
VARVLLLAAGIFDHPNVDGSQDFPLEIFDNAAHRSRPQMSP